MSEPVVDYERPPVVEVAAGVNFDRLPADALVHFGLFWQTELAEAFPQVQQKPPAVVATERFGEEMFYPVINFADDEDKPLSRLWFLTKSGDELLQLQRDWFACNWRKVNADVSYSHWPSRREAFLKWYRALSDYVSSAGLGRLNAKQCEVSYVNHIAAGETWKTHGEISKIFRSIGETALPDHLVRESTRFGQEFLMLGDDGKPAGRLHVSAQPAFSVGSRAPLYVLELTARGVPRNSDVEGVIDFLDKGRKIIVSTFAAITSDEIQQEWGLR